MSTVTATVATPPQVQYKTLTTNKQAPRDKNKNLIIGIRLDHANQVATFACIPVEHVGSHKARKVFFTASGHCFLHFTNPVVFGTDSIELFEEKEQWRVVNESITNAETSYYVTVGKALIANVLTTEETVISPEPKAPPQIVVP